jgi:mannose-6-phosphate isomerase-like protein (cupin superfamily)
MASSLRISRGVATLSIADDGELNHLSDHSFEVGEGDVLLVPPGVHYRFINETGGELEYSEHQIRPEVAFV